VAKIVINIVSIRKGLEPFLSMLLFCKKVDPLDSLLRMQAMAAVSDSPCMIVKVLAICFNFQVSSSILTLESSLLFVWPFLFHYQPAINSLPAPLLCAWWLASANARPES
jgi:hypothetical protein